MESKASSPAAPRLLVLVGLVFFVLFVLRPVSLALAGSVAVGYDSTGHASKLLVWLTDGYETPAWWPAWYSGSPHFSSYPWLSYVPDLLLLRLASSLGFPPRDITFNLLTLTELIAEISVVAGFLLFIRKTTTSSSSAFLAILAILASPIFFNDWLNGGRIAEIVGAVGFPWSLYFLEAYREKGDSKSLFLSALAVYWAVAAHFVTGAITVGTVFAWALFTFDRSRIFKIVRSSLILGILLSAYWLIPFGSWLLVSSQGISSETDRAFVTLQTILGLNVQRYDASPVVVVLVFFLLIMIAATASRGWLGGLRKPLVFLALGSVFYLFFVGPLFGMSYPAGLGVLIFLKWATIFSAVFIGLAHGHVSGFLGSNRRKIITIALAVVLIAWLPVASLSVTSPPVVANTEIDAKFLTPLELKAPGIASKDFRFGSDTDTISEGYNFYFPSAMQTRGYGTQFVVNPNWQFYLEDTFWRHETAQESMYLADWFSMRYFATRTPASENLFRNDSSFRQIGTYQDTGRVQWTVFDYADASPIISATNSTRILVIGEPSTYEIVFRALAFANFSSKSGITIRGESSVTASSNLTDFDTVFLYDYNYNSTDRPSMWQTLKDYVSGGGRLVVETGLSPDSRSDSMPEPFPVDRLFATDAGKVWQFSTSNDSLTSGIDFASFSPAVYSGVAWGVSLASNSSLRPGARAVAWLSGKPAVVVRSVGNGTLVWTGLNLPYHIVSYHNSVESELLARLLSGRLLTRYPTFQVARPDSDTIEVTVSTPALGVLVKEFYFDDAAYHWVARVFSGNTIAEAEILRAGPDFMYIPIVTVGIYPVKVVLKFEPKLPVAAANLVSVIGFLFVTLSLVLPKSIARLWRPVHDRLNAARSRLSEWWLRD
jgi:hypothetical protein